ncbi:glycosyltransferase [Magnetofaba australis]|uniref:Putative glycosyltransferase n=1 Tax=Magnetofaba australis IT-1 TaxID=1434232 RepID=A0A1Y2K5A8_9PROT|nr:glycosyltransferase [Magnetofaba australis]OSM04439.1 putative glycosyltransferase [Magnetofaba australis IT-1]
MTYQPQDFAILVPTKDRPEKMREMLDSVLAQNIHPGRIIVIDGSDNPIDAVTDAYADKLPVERYACRPPGQIRQRNMGISKLDESTPVVILLDDDIVLEPGAFQALVDFWNAHAEDCAGVSFNIVNMDANQPSTWRRFFLMDAWGPGRVLKSGYNTSVCNVSESHRTQWLPGGATSWRLELLKKNTHEEIYAKRALCEDLIFSFPIGAQGAGLYVCHDARVRHEHVTDHTKKAVHRYYGKVETLWRLFFVSRNDALSIGWFLWSMLGTILADLINGARRFERRRLELALGRTDALLKAAWVKLRGKPLVEALREDG